MRLPRALVLASILVLLAGCSGSPPASVEGTGEEGPDGVAEGKSPAEEGPSTTKDVAVVNVLDHEFDYGLADAAPPTTMEVPANATALFARFSRTAGAPCGIIGGDPDDPTYPASVVFVSPSGKRSDLPMPPTICQVGPVTMNSEPQTLGLDPEPGTWQVSFRGRGLLAHAHLVVEAQVG